MAYAAEKKAKDAKQNEKEARVCIVKQENEGNAEHTAREGSAHREMKRQREERKSKVKHENRSECKQKDIRIENKAIQSKAKNSKEADSGKEENVQSKTQNREINKNSAEQRAMNGKKRWTKASQASHRKKITT